MCAEPSCDRVVVARGYCKKHWQQVNRWGETRDSILRADPIVRAKNAPRPTRRRKPRRKP